MKKAEIQIEKMKASDLIQYTYNSKDHPEKQVDAIATSIQLFCFNNPLIIDNDNVIVAWHWRFLAAKKLWLEELPCIRVWHLNDVEVAWYRLADNILAEMWTTNTENLQIEVERIDIPFLNDLVKVDIQVNDNQDDTEVRDYSAKNKEVNPDDLLNGDDTCTCPKCGFEFLNDK